VGANAAQVPSQRFAGRIASQYRHNRDDTIDASRCRKIEVCEYGLRKLAGSDRDALIPGVAAAALSCQ